MNLTEIIFLLDRSGSMAGLESDTIGGFNSFVEKQSKIREATKVTAVLFDDKYEILWNGLDAEKVKLTSNEYFVRGSTALLDAVGKTILDISYRLSKADILERPRKVIFVITTDGLENASKEFTHDKVKSLIKQQQEKYEWEFIFLGANIDASKEASSIGICKENTFKFDASEAGVNNMFCMVNDIVAERRFSK